jgi:SAM-dependent methyltransferase
VLGADISRLLIDQAGQRNEIANAAFVVADAATHAFEAGAYDLVFSRFGVMFFGDPVAAFANIRRALKRSGRLVFVCWRPLSDNPWAGLPIRAGAAHLPPAPRPGPEDPGPFAFGDRTRVERILGEAGFGPPSVRPLDRLIRLGKDLDEALDGVTRLGPASRLFVDATPAESAAAKAAIAEALRPHVGPGGVMLAGACWLVSAAQS